ncbi:peroxiredoxin family protein [Megalodesulfovibrio gigas]|uniref:Putative redoxin domain-containing protein n=1 Tax=Megalodesulfovibrio gigas (strain ATCC 19364 / DSM 1382 / NCIMB 9332 / VKM B-1759) TaxID=1121448 RepID=T2G815_MEGG1|nr:TlpA disulfide reductase family protein [Megalodesulfovibrio gigas]AGW12281.1 putative redoxin domain-containing protein [Megalodesulfovibrio gigas DSM 1382 = ATCC 19364]
MPFAVAIRVVLLCALCLGLYGPVAAEAAAPPAVEGKTAEGQALPAITLAGPLTARDAAILGLPEGKPFALTDIRTPFLLLQLYSMYCPHCQREAPHIKAMYELMVRRGLDKQITLLGLGVGNSAFEVGVFREQYAIPFPLVPDKEFSICEATGRVGTPHYLLAQREGDAWKVLFLHEGAFEDPQAFLTLLLKKTGVAAAK